MLEFGLTSASLAGAAAYGVTALLALMASRHKPGDSLRWRMVAGLFLGLAAWRLGLGEIRLQDDLREWMQIHGVYEQRRKYQALVTLAVLAGACLGLYRLRWGDGFSRPALALNAGMCLVVYSLIRLISLHQIDSLLFRIGPIHLNYLIDLGLTACAAAQALQEIRYQIGPRQRSRGIGR
jgi:hypothetical protein